MRIEGAALGRPSKDADAGCVGVELGTPAGDIELQRPTTTVLRAGLPARG